MTAGALYGLRGSGPKPKTVTTDSRDQAIEHHLPGDVIVVSYDGGNTWENSRIQVREDGEVRDYGSMRCDDCGVGLLLPGWLCPGCAEGRGIR